MTRLSTLARTAERVLRWPAGWIDGYRLPWYVVAWRLFWMPLYVAGLLLAFTAIAIQLGPSHARAWWDFSSWPN